MDKQICKRCGFVLWEKTGRGMTGEIVYNIYGEIILEPPILIKCPKCGEVQPVSKDLGWRWE